MPDIFGQRLLALARANDQVANSLRIARHAVPLGQDEADRNTNRSSAMKQPTVSLSEQIQMGACDVPWV